MLGAQHPPQWRSWKGEVLCVVAPKSIRGSGETARNKAWIHQLSSVLRGSQVYTRVAKVYTFPKMLGKLGRGGEICNSHQDSKGLLQRSPGHSVSGSSQAVKENGKEGGEREGGGRTGKAFKQLQLPDMWPHLCSVF